MFNSFDNIVLLWEWHIKVIKGLISQVRRDSLQWHMLVPYKCYGCHLRIHLKLVEINFILKKKESRAKCTKKTLFSCIGCLGIEAKPANIKHLVYKTMLSLQTITHFREPTNKISKNKSLDMEINKNCNSWMSWLELSSWQRD